MRLPLDGIRVLDLSRALAGPWCAAILGDLGAEIIKVEGTGGGDPARAWGPFDGRRSLYFDSVNRGKSSLGVDFRAPGAIELMRELIGGVDVLIENFRPGVMTEMGLDPDELRRDHPGLVIASISGYGSTGPERTSPGLDQVAQGMSGLMSVTGSDPEHIYRLGVPIVDELSGLFTAIGILAALVGRAAVGDGSRVDTSLLEAGIAAMTFHAQEYLSLGRVPGPQGNHHPVIAPYGAFRAADGQLTIAVGSAKHWQVFCRVIGASELLEREEYATGGLRKEHHLALAADVEKALGARTVAEWLAEFKAAGIPAGPIYRVDQTFADPQVRALELFSRVPDGTGREVPVLRSPLSIDGRRLPARTPAPEQGEQSRKVLAEFGLSPQRIDELIADSVVIAPAATEQPA